MPSGRYFNTALYYYTEAQNFLEAARNGDRLAALQAYEDLNNCLAFPGDDAILNQAVDCAISRFYALIRKKLD